MVASKVGRLMIKQLINWLCYIGGFDLVPVSPCVLQMADEMRAYVKKVDKMGREKGYSGSAKRTIAIHHLIHEYRPASPLDVALALELAVRKVRGV